jgi:hypothetical protein
MVVQTNSTTSGQQSSSSAPSAIGRHPPTHMTPLSRPQTGQQGNSPDSPGDKTGNIVAIMMMNQASDRDKQRQEQEERRKKYHLQMELQHQQMQQQQNMMTILLMNVVGMMNY